VPNVQEAVPEKPATGVVQVTLVDEALVATTVAVAPSVIPVKSIVGVVSRVELSVELEPVSDAEFKSGVGKSSICTMPVAEEVPVTLAAALVAVTTERM
jgi:hypothetical protein